MGLYRDSIDASLMIEKKKKKNFGEKENYKK